MSGHATKARDPAPEAFSMAFSIHLAEKQRSMDTPLATRWLGDIKWPMLLLHGIFTSVYGRYSVSEQGSVQRAK
jgi:hypothetical protein